MVREPGPLLLFAPKEAPVTSVHYLGPSLMLDWDSVVKIP